MINFIYIYIYIYNFINKIIYIIKLMYKFRKKKINTKIVLLLIRMEQQKNLMQT